MLAPLAVAVFRKTDALRHCVRLVFAEVFLRRTGIPFDDLQGHAATAQTVVESELCRIQRVASANLRASRGDSTNDVPWQLRGCSCAVTNNCKRSSWVLAVCLILDSRTLGKGTSARSSSEPPPHNSMLRLRCKLTAQDLDGSVLLSGMWERMLIMCSWLVDASVSHVEFAHGTTRRRACGSELSAHFVSKHILEDIMRRLKHVPEACRAFRACHAW